MSNVISENPSSSFSAKEYEFEHSTSINLSVYNHLGQQVAVLADGIQAAGRQQVQWEAEGFPSGIYYCRLTAGGQIFSGKIMLK